MSYEDQVRRQMEQVAKDEQVNQCPAEGEVDAAFGFREMKKAIKKAAGQKVSRLGKKSLNVSYTKKGRTKGYSIDA